MKVKLKLYRNSFLVVPNEVKTMNKKIFIFTVMLSLSTFSLCSCGSEQQADISSSEIDAVSAKVDTLKREY